MSINPASSTDERRLRRSSKIERTIFDTQNSVGTVVQARHCFHANIIFGSWCCGEREICAGILWECGAEGGVRSYAGKNRIEDGAQESHHRTQRAAGAVEMWTLGDFLGSTATSVAVTWPERCGWTDITSRVRLRRAAAIGESLRTQCRGRDVRIIARQDWGIWNEPQKGILSWLGKYGIFVGR